MRLFFEGAAVFGAVYMAASYNSSAHLDGYASLQWREKLLHCAAEAALFAIPVYGVASAIVLWASRIVRDDAGDLRLPIIYGLALFSGGLIGLATGLVFSTTSAAGIAMAANLPLPTACGAGAGMLTLIGRRFHHKFVYRLWEWALILSVSGLVVWLNESLRQ